MDGNLFSTAEIATLARHTVFDSPNTFENGLQEFNDLFACRLGVCFRKSRLVNIPCNKVQADNANTHGQLHQADLLRRWQDGYRIDHASLAGLSNVSAHQEIDLVFEKRNGVNG